MPILGWFLGTSMQETVGAFAPWLAFGLLCAIGLKMIFDGLSGFETKSAFQDKKTLRLVFLGLATSIDAFAIGISLGIVAKNIWIAAVIIGLVTAILCAIGVGMGDRLSEKVESNAELLGGLILIGIGIRMLVG
jgi:putative Mn2+ efflux pump MntP